MTYQSIDEAPFDAQVTLADAYRVMLQFLQDIEDRAPTELWWVLNAYAGLGPDGSTTDPAAAYDYLAAVRTVLPVLISS